MPHVNYQRRREGSWLRPLVLLRRHRNIAFTTGTNVALTVLGGATGVMSARLLGPQGRGELAAIQLLPNILAGIALLGLPEAVVYFSARQRDAVGRYMASAVVMACASASLAVIAGWTIVPFLLSQQSPAVVDAARVYLLLVPLFALMGIPYQSFRALGYYRVWNCVRLAIPAGWVIVLVLGFVAQSWDAVVLSRLYLLLLILEILPLAYAVRRLVPPPRVVDRSLCAPLLRFGVPTAITFLPQVLNIRLDQLIVATALSPADLGVYIAAVGWSSLLMPVPAAMSSLLFPQVASRESATDKAALIARYTRVAVVTSLLVSCLALPVTPLGIRVLFGSQFASAQAPALFLVLAASLLGVNMVAEDGLRGLGKPTAVLRAEVAGVSVTAIALFVAIPRYQLAGAAVASAAGYAVTTVSLFCSLRRSTSKPIRAFLVPTASDLALLTKRGAASETAR